MFKQFMRLSTLLNKFSKRAVAEPVEATAAVLGIQTSLRQAQASFCKLSSLFNGRLSALFLLFILVACQTAVPENDTPPTDVPATATTESVTEETEEETAVSEPETEPETETETTTSEQTDLPVDEFFELVMADLLTRNPEYATASGLQRLVDASIDTQLTNESPAYQAETADLLAQHLETLRNYDQTTLTEEQQLSTAVLEWYLEDVLRQEQFAQYDYRMNPMIGFPWEFTNLMHSAHPLTNKTDAAAYISRLNQFDVKVEQLIAEMEAAETAGVLPPRWMFGWTINSLQGNIQNNPQRSEFYMRFKNEVSELDDISEAEKEALYAQVETAVSEKINPGYEKLVATLQDQMSRANNDDGAWKHPDGDAYYQVALQHHTTTDLTADEIHEIGLAEVARIQAELQLIFDELGYPREQSLTDSMRQVAFESGLRPTNTEVEKQAVLAEYEELTREAETAVAPYFDILPKAALEIDYVEQGAAHYIPPALDGSRPGVFYANLGGSQLPGYTMPTLTYHEAVPGHHFQIALQGELEGLPTFRNDFTFTAYVEGWALYAEQLAAEIGMYEDDPYGDIGRLQMELFRAARLVVDTGLHSKQWTQDTAVNYMIENTGLPQGMIGFEVNRYIGWPGQATAYKIGQLKILELRDLAQAELGDDFDLREFHNVVLQNGSLPLSILEQVVLDYIAEESSG